MPETTATTPLTLGDHQTLLHVAHTAIEHGLHNGFPMLVDPAAYPEPLAQHRATFVTIQLRGELHGCIGTIEPIRPLVVEVGRCAYAAAFEDPRFEPLMAHDMNDLALHISILSLSEPMRVANEADLLRQLRPGIDGLILEEPQRGRRSTFLPAVWDKLPTPLDFVTQLKLKAGLPADYWSTTLQLARYTAESIG